MVLGTTLVGWAVLRTLLQIPDGYAIDVARDPPAYATGVDADNLVSIDLPTHSRLGNALIRLRYDAENRPLGSGSDAVNVRIEWRF
jgi:hypothetical protein